MDGIPTRAAVEYQIGIAVLLGIPQPLGNCSHRRIAGLRKQLLGIFSRQDDIRTLPRYTFYRHFLTLPGFDSSQCCVFSSEYMVFEA